MFGILLSELERRAAIKLVNKDDDCDGKDKRISVSPDVIKRTVEFVVGPSIHRWIRIRPIRLKRIHWKLSIQKKYNYFVTGKFELLGFS